MGSLTVAWQGLEFQLSGFTDLERTNAELKFPIGSSVTFRYTDTTKEGMPKCARYWRQVVTQ